MQAPAADGAAPSTGPLTARPTPSGATAPTCSCARSSPASATSACCSTATTARPPPPPPAAPAPSSSTTGPRRSPSAPPPPPAGARRAWCVWRPGGRRPVRMSQGAPVVRGPGVRVRSHGAPDGATQGLSPPHPHRDAAGELGAGKADGEGVPAAESAGGPSRTPSGASALWAGCCRRGVPHYAWSRPQMRPQILFDHVRVRSGFSRNGVSVSVTANSTMHVDIPAIGASITMHGEAFQILLSYSYFRYNTEGQCGEWGRSRSPTGAHACSSRHILPVHPGWPPVSRLPHPHPQICPCSPRRPP